MCVVPGYEQGKLLLRPRTAHAVYLHIVPTDLMHSPRSNGSFFMIILPRGRMGGCYNAGANKVEWEILPSVNFDNSSMFVMTLKICLLHCCIVPVWVSTKLWSLVTSSIQNCSALSGLRIS